MEVYLMRMGRHFKVGRSKDSARRLGQLRSIKFPSSEPIELLHSVATPYARQLEWRLHRYLEDKRVNGEWFQLTAKQVGSVIALMNKGFEPVKIKAESAAGALSIAEAAKRLGLSRQAVYNAIRDGRIPSVEVGVLKTMITPAALSAFKINPNMKRSGRNGGKSSARRKGK